MIIDYWFMILNLNSFIERVKKSFQSVAFEWAFRMNLKRLITYNWLQNVCSSYCLICQNLNPSHHIDVMVKCGEIDENCSCVFFLQKENFVNFLKCSTWIGDQKQFWNIVKLRTFNNFLALNEIFFVTWREFEFDLLSSKEI